MTLVEAGGLLFILCVLKPEAGALHHWSWLGTPA